MANSTGSVMATGANSLGLKNPHHHFGVAFLVKGAALAIISLTRVVVATMQPWDWLFVVIGLIWAVWSLFVGLTLISHLLVDTTGPAEIRDDSNTVDELLIHKRFRTYKQPSGIISALVHRLFPELTYLTPPYEELRSGTWRQLIYVVIALTALFLMPYLGMGVIPVLIIAVLSLTIRIAALKSAAGKLQDAQPATDVYEGKEHLVKAGNPIDLFNHLQAALDELRVQGFQNRILTELAPEAGANATTNRVATDYVIETQPVPLDDDRRPSHCVFVLTAGGASLTCIGFACLLFAGATGLTVGTGLLLVAAWIALESGTYYERLAQGILCTFRFHSDLLKVSMNGSYMVNTVSVGNNINSFVATEGQVFKSDIVATVYGCRVITECGLPLYGFWQRFGASPYLSRAVLNSSTRYVLSAHLDSGFRDRLNFLLSFLRNYRDQGDQLRTPEMSQENITNMIAQNLSMAQALESAKAQGVIDGQQRALQNMGGDAAARGGYISQQSPPNVDTQSSPTHVRWKCPKCQRSLKAKAEAAGKSIKCPSCNQSQSVPAS